MTLARVVGFALALLLAVSAIAMKQDITLGRYEARAIVTGTDMRSRPVGLAACLTDVLVKVSGDPTLADDPAWRRWPRTPPISWRISTTGTA